MGDRTPRAAFERFADPLQQMMSVVVPSGRAVLTMYPGPLQVKTDHWLSFPGGAAVRLAGLRLHLKVIHGFRIESWGSPTASFGVTTTRYSYHVLDEEHRELFAYHYNPQGVGWCTYPHLHVRSAANVFAGKAHLITGPVLLPAVIRMLIEDPAIPVAPLRPDWPRVLDAAQQELERAGSWK